MPTIILSEKAENDFAHLAKAEQRKVIKKLKILQSEPFSGKPLLGKLKGLWSLRAWPYRIIYELDKSKKIIIYRIIHRQRACKE
ncbi:MAG TPA: type II toxin-antitoxin system RelE/ParE family toxin [Candidatus Bathyarchaeia archaeon]|nr:type II toxin-antitoxin system RelE/ParE family toxin [Candidatus Bathyarchaeia archaeon]